MEVEEEYGLIVAGAVAVALSEEEKAATGESNMNCPYCYPNSAGQHDINCPMYRLSTFTYVTTSNDTRICFKCGNALDPTWVFCPHCGEYLRGVRVTVNP